VVFVYFRVGRGEEEDVQLYRGAGRGPQLRVCAAVAAVLRVAQHARPHPTHAGDHGRHH